jgi:hypothetical protein
VKRIVQPEWLDSLPPDDPRAIRSRKDLIRVNGCMRNPQIMNRALRVCMNGSAKIIELGAGDGRFLLSVARGFVRQRQAMTATLLDQQDNVSSDTRLAFAALGWNLEAVVADAFDWLKTPGAGQVLVANLFLHHFEEDRLARLLELVARRAELFIAVEPWRAFWPLFCSRLLWGIGCNDVTRHDAVVSVQAGFSGNELSRLWPEKSGWRLTERAAGAFSHLFIAQKIH